MLCGRPVRSTRSRSFRVAASGCGPLPTTGTSTTLRCTASPARSRPCCLPGCPCGFQAERTTTGSSTRTRQASCFLSEWSADSIGRCNGSLLAEVVVKMRGRLPLPRSVRLAFWEGIRAGLPVRVAAEAVGCRAAEEWLRAAGGVVGNAPRPVGGRYLSVAEREEIAVGLAAGQSCRQIAARLGRPASTVSREIGRNSSRLGYRAVAAQAQAEFRAARPKTARLAGNARLRGWVQERLEERWSPEQISAALRREFPDDREMRVSHETIYQSIYVQGRGGA